MRDYNFCPYCGKSLPSAADYCPSCGSHMVRPGHTPLAQPATPVAEAQAGGVISGIITDAQGHPLRNVEVHARTPTEVAGRPLARYVTQSDEQGAYSMEVPSYPYELSAYIKVLYRGKQWERQLHPTDDSNNVVTPKGHISKDFRWQLTGLVPGGEPDNRSSYYGGYIQARWGNSNYELQSPVSLESIFQFTLTPSGPLIDGSLGEVLTMKRTVATLQNWEGSLDTTLYLYNIPIGPYTATATLTLPNGSRYQVAVSTNTGTVGKRVPGESVALEFPPSLFTSSENLNLFLDFL